MSKCGYSQIDLPITMRIFASDATLVARLSSEDPSFRSICEDYELAAATLTRLLGEDDRKSETNEYLLLATELENEIRSLLRNAT